MCTAVKFEDNKGNVYFGRNLDWTTDYGEKVVITPRGYRYDSAFLGELAVKYAAIGMAVVAENKPLYFDCGNEAGLTIAGLNFPGYAQYESRPVEGKTNLAPYEFPLWVAMNFATVNEVEEALAEVALVNQALNPEYPVSMLHWMIADNTRSIVVEYTANGMEIFHNEVNILTNQPGYEWHKENLRNFMNLTSAEVPQVRWGQAEMKPFGSGALMQGLPGGYYPSARFVRAAYLNTRYPVQETEEANVARMFHTLASVAMIDGAAVASDGKFEKTIYTSCYSSASKTYCYNTYNDLTIRKVVLDEAKLDGTELVVE